ncbi:hypothetical protein ACFSX5_09665 [Devosia albogilva]|uniref:Uncharacterized protein n=1 Tax=Devosia albogilva TaxID=429726 RepID=A0ABW5QKI3_9HYPH
MRVKLYVSEVQDRAGKAQMLVLQDGPSAAIPLRLQDREWRLLGTTATSDHRIPATAAAVEAALRRDGHCVLELGVDGSAPD